MTTTYRSEAGKDTEITRADRDGLLARARSLGPLIRKHAGEAEQGRRLSQEVIGALGESGFFRLLLPRSLGGLEVDPVTCALIVEEVAGFDSAAAWALQAGNTSAWWAARLATNGAEEIYTGNPSALVAAAFHPPQQAVETAGGYRITGRGPLASTIHDAEWLLLTAMVLDGNRPKMLGDMPQIIGLVLRAREAQVVDTWDSLGMRGTDSNDVVVNDVFVPAARTFPLSPEFEPGAHHRGPLYRFPGAASVSFVIAPIPLAVARGAISELKELAQRKTALGFNRPLRERGVVQVAVAKAEAMLRAARLFFYDTLDVAWARTVAGEGSTLQQKADLLLAGAHAATTAASVADMMHRVAGTTGIYASNPLERHLRDTLTLRHHGFLSENRFETAGQVYLGVAPEFALVAF
jgi:indole-3-acetate monooxygenase